MLRWGFSFSAVGSETGREIRERNKLGIGCDTATMAPNLLADYMFVYIYKYIK